MGKQQDSNKTQRQMLRHRMNYDGENRSKFQSIRVRVGAPLAHPVGFPGGGGGAPPRGKSVRLLAQESLRIG